MKRTKIILLAFFISTTTFSFVSGQEKKNEEKVKIVIADKSGTKVVIDTIFTGEKPFDSLLLKDGKIIYFREKTGDNDILNSKDNTDTRYEVIAKLEKDGEKSGTSYIYINDGKTIHQDTDARFDIKSDKNDIDGDTNKARYVVAKNGIVVSIEGNDEAKVKELIDFIEKRLDISKDESSDINIDKNSEKKVEKIK